MKREPTRSDTPKRDPADALDPGVQESAKMGVVHDDLLKRTARRHPQRDIPRAEDIDVSMKLPKE